MQKRNYAEVCKCGSVPRNIFCRYAKRIFVVAIHVLPCITLLLPHFEFELSSKTPGAFLSNILLICYSYNRHIISLSGFRDEFLVPTIKFWKLYPSSFFTSHRVFRATSGNVCHIRSTRGKTTTLI